MAADICLCDLLL